VSDERQIYRHDASIDKFEKTEREDLLPKDQMTWKTFASGRRATASCLSVERMMAWHLMQEMNAKK